MKRLMFTTAFLLASCGTDKVVQSENPSPIQPPIDNRPPTQGTTWAEMERLHAEYCIQCHANSGFVRNEAALRASSSEQRVRNGSMPPPNGPAMPNAERQLYLNFFSG